MCSHPLVGSWLFLAKILSNKRNRKTRFKGKLGHKAQRSCPVPCLTDGYWQTQDWDLGLVFPACALSTVPPTRGKAGELGWNWNHELLFPAKRGGERSVFQKIKRGRREMWAKHRQVHLSRDLSSCPRSAPSWKEPPRCGTLPRRCPMPTRGISGLDMPIPRASPSR